MGPLIVAGVSCALMLAGAAVGAHLRRALPSHHLDGNCKDIVRLGGGLVATIVAVVLGFLISSANGKFEAQRTEMRRMAADIMLLDHLLESYGAETRPIRALIRQGIGQVVDRIWISDSHAAPDFGPHSISAEVYRAIQTLPAPNPQHHIVRTQAATLAIDIARTRLMLFEAMHAPLPLALVGVLVFWLTMLFLSFSLFSPVNPTALGALMVIAVSASTALFLFLEMSDPFTGLMHVPSGVLSNILPPLA